MKTLILLAHFLAILSLISCSDDSSDSGSSGGSAPAAITTAILADPYIFNGVLFWDKNKNLIWDVGEPFSGPSDVNGLAKFDMVIPAGEIIGQHRAGTMDGFNYPGRLRGISIGEGTVVLNPMTTLLANGFSEDELVALFANIGINITPEQLYENPMLDPTVLEAALTLATGLIQNPKGFGLAPPDTEPVSNGIAMINTYSQDFLTNSAQIYNNVIGKLDFENQIVNSSKTSSSFLDYISRYGTGDFMVGDTTDEGNIDDALTVISGEFASSQNVLQPIVLISEITATPTDSKFSATVLKNVWFQPGDYDALGFRILEANLRVIEDTIANYPQGPQSLRILFMDTVIAENSFLYTYQRDQGESELNNYQIEWKFNPDTNQLSLVEALTQENGAKPENVQTREDLLLSTTDFLNTLVYRTMLKERDDQSSLTEIKRLIGDGEKILTYYGIDWGADPQNPLPWRINTARTNNCLTGSPGERGVTDNCEAEDVTLKYIMAREELSNHSVETLSSAEVLGPSTDFTFSFILKNRSLSGPNTESPIELIISDIETTEGKLEKVSEDCVQVNVEGAVRPALCDSPNIDFFVGYEDFPPDYKVWAINRIEITTFGGSGQIYSTRETSSFYKEGFLVAQLIEDPPFGPPPFEFLIMDVGSREGVAVSFVKEWEENGTVKFLYRDFDKIEIKQIAKDD